MSRHGKVAHTHIEELSKGGGQVPMCRGGCGKPMPEGQSCFDCAVKAVADWKGRRNASH